MTVISIRETMNEVKKMFITADTVDMRNITKDM